MIHIILTSNTAKILLPKTKVSTWKRIIHSEGIFSYIQSEEFDKNGIDGKFTNSF